MRNLGRLIRAHLLLEFRYRETVVLLTSLSLILAVIIALGMQSAFLDPNQKQKLFPVLLWIVFLFSATVSVGRSFEYETENAALDSLFLCGVSPTVVYLSKTISNFIVLFIGHLCGLFALTLFLNVHIGSALAALLEVSGVVLFAYAAIATLLAGVTVSARMRHILLPLILLPMLFPLFSGAIELSTDALQLTRVDHSSVWFSLLIALNVVYVALGINLFEYVVRE